MTYRWRAWSMEGHPGPEGHLSFHLLFVLCCIVINWWVDWVDADSPSLFKSISQTYLS